MTPSPESVAFELYAPYTSTPSNPHPQNIAFWELQNSLRRNLEILHADHHRHTDSRLLFQKRWKSVQDKWPKGRVVFLPKKKHFAPFGGTPGRFPHILSDTLLLFITYRPIPSFVQIGSGLKSYSGKILPLPAEVIEMCRLFEPLIKSSRTRKSRHWVRCLRDIQSCTSWCSRLQTLGHQSDASARFPHSVHERKLS